MTRVVVLLSLGLLTGAVILTEQIVYAQSTAPGQSNAGPPKKLQDLLPGIQWETRVLTLDCDCDGKNDRVYLGRFKGNVFVGFVSATGSVDMLEFAVNPSVQRAICREPAKLDVESLDYDPTEAVGRIDGFVRSKTCKGLRLSGGGGCDHVHIFWNRKTGSLDWWRL